LPREAIAVLGNTHSKRIDTMNKDMIINSYNQTEIKMSQEVAGAMLELRKYLFEHFYLGSPAKKEENKAMQMLKMLFEYYLESPEKILSESNYTKQEHLQAITDYIAGMTDRFAVKSFNKIFVPKGFE
jgi:dGTPase